MNRLTKANIRSHQSLRAGKSLAVTQSKNHIHIQVQRLMSIQVQRSKNTQVQRSAIRTTQATHPEKVQVSMITSRQTITNDPIRNMKRKHTTRQNHTIHE